MFNVATNSTVKNSLTSVKNILRNGTALSKSVLTMAGMLALSSTAQANDNFTTPQGENVVGGSASFSRAQGQLDVNQHSNRAVINWDHFNIGKDATVQFAQPNSGSMAVNRVVGPQTDPTKILGTLKANGQVAVLDRNGVIFRPGSKVDVAGLIASTGDIDVNKFMNEGVFELSNFGNGSVINEGTITIADHGLAAFVAPTVENNGIITAKMGRVQLAGTTQVTTVDLYGDGLLEIAVNEETAQTLVQNTGNIDAEGGVVAMTATAAKGIVDNIINTEGVVSVASATTDGGKIILGGSKDGGNVRVAGTLDASGANGGSVDVTGYDIETTTDASVDVSGSEGNGGSAVFFAENNAVYANKFDATGADAELELGGFVETSAKQTVDFLEGIDVQVGLGGTWLIDPTNIDIDATLASSLVTTMNGGGAGIVDTASPDPDAGNITFLADVIWTGQGSLSLTADNNIILGNYTVQSGYASGNGTRGAVSFVADNNIRSNGGSIITARGNVSLDAGGQVRLVDTTLDSTNGAFVLDAGSTFLLDNSTITTTKDLALISTGLMTIKGGSTVTATNRTVDLDANNGLSLIQNSTIAARTLDIDAKRVQQSENAQIEVDNLQGTVRGAADFSGTDNQVKTVQNFDTGTNSALYSGGFTLVDSDEGLDVAGIITASGGDVSLTTAGTNNKNLTVRASGAIQSNGGEINLTSTDSKVSVSGQLDATGSDSAITLSGTDIILGNGSVIQSEDGVAPFDGALTLTATDGVINQNAGSTIITASLVGSSTKATNLQGTANQVGEVLGFTTGVVGVENGGFKLVEADGFVVSGDIVSQGGAIELKTNSSGFVEAIDIASSGGIFSNNGNITLDTNGASGGAVFVNGQINGGASGNLTFNARQAQLRNGSTIGGNRTTFTGGLVTQNAGSTMTVGRIDGTLNAYAYFDGAANEIGGFGDFATGVAGFSDGGIRVTDILGGFSITGDVSTDGAAIEINTQGGNFTQSGGKTISTNGGTFTLRNFDSKATFAGTVDTTGATDANITVRAAEVALNGNSIITAGGADVDVTATNGKITQGNNSQLIANVLTGSATDLVRFNGDANDIVELNGFTSNGNFLFEDGNAGFVVTGDILSNGGKIDFVANTANWNDDIEVVNGVTLNSDGGNVTFENTAGRVIMRHGSVLNAGTGNVTFDLGGALQLQGSNSLTADNLSVTASKATQSSNATLNVDTLEVTTQMDAAFEGGANQINQLRDIKTGEAIWNDGGFTLVDSTGGLVINGDVSSTGEAISITTAGGELSLNGSRSVTSGGGDISLAQMVMLISAVQWMQQDLTVMSQSLGQILPLMVLRLFKQKMVLPHLMVS